MKFAAFCAVLAYLSSCALAVEVSPADALRDRYYLTERELWKNVIDQYWNVHAELGADVELAKAFYKLNDLMESVPAPTRPQLENSWLWSRALEKLQIIDGLYKEFLDFCRRQASPGGVAAPVREWLDVAEHVLMDPHSSVSHAVKKVSELLEHGDLFRNALQGEHPDRCELQMSPHQLIYDMYNTITLTEIKGYAMMQFSWMLLRIYGKGNFTQEASLTRQRYGERTAKTAAAARNALSMARRDLYRCDPPHHIEGDTYAQVTRLLQGYIENEVDMNQEGTCRDNCAYYSIAEHQTCFKEKFCAQQSACGGRIFNCQYIDSDMSVCLANHKSNRRYDWIKYENGRTLGNAAGSCSRGTTQVDSWWRWLFWHCSYCMCLCDEGRSLDSQRYFSLKEAVSDVTNNKVVTGLRMVKMDRVFHLQVSDGTLGERGAVTHGDWLAVQKFDPNDVGRDAGVDYHMLTYESRAIDLDELDSPTGHVLTGVRFSMVGAHIHFEIRSTPFNYTSGRLVPDRSVWISNDNTEGADSPRSRLDLVNPDIPIRAIAPLPVDSTHDQYVEFTNSDLEADAAQSTVPFIDIQEVRPLNGGGLASGAGIIHRGARGSGGFIGVKLFTYDYSRHVHADPPPREFLEEPDTADIMPAVY